MNEEISEDSMEKYVKDAGAYEENLSKDQLLQIYSALKDSENMASEENQTRSISQSQDELLLDESDGESNTIGLKPKSFTSKTWTSEKKALFLEAESNHDDIVISSQKSDDNNDTKIDYQPNDSVKDIIQTSISFNDMPASNKDSTLTVIHHDLEYVGIQNSQKFLNADHLAKVKMLFFYHIAKAKLKTRLAKLSTNMAALPKCISQISSDCMPSTTTDEIDFKETYVSRSGRQTKRKTYYDDDSSQEAVTSNKKAKSDDEFEWHCKAAVGPRSTSKKPENLHPNIEIENEITLENTDKDKENNKNNENKTAQKLKVYSKKPKNSEIMERSGLFKDFNGTRKTRSEELFSALLEEDEKKKKQEQVIDSFSKTLPSLEEEELEDIIPIEDEPEQVRRRVVPTIPGRKAINSRRRKPGLDPLPVKSTPVPKKFSLSKMDSDDDFEENKAPNNSPAGKRPSLPRPVTAEAEPSTSRAGKSNTVPCPLCNVHFHPDQIMAHASSCGDDVITRSMSAVAHSITCNICDKLVPYDTTYQVHVKECMARSTR